MALVCSALIAAMALGPIVVSQADAAPTVDKGQAVQMDVTIPKDVPLRMFTTFSGKLSGEAVKGDVFEFSYDGLRPKPLIGQRDPRDGRIWFQGVVTNPNLPGKTISITLNRADAKPAVTIVSKPEGFQFLDDGRPVMFYQREPKSKNGTHLRANYVHPLLGLDGEVLTQDFPSDHLHHRGVFWAWHQLWIGEQRAGNAWLCDGFLAEVTDARILDQGPVFATLKVDVNWTSANITDADGKPKPIVAEQTLIRLYHATRNSQFVDFEVSIKPVLEDVAIGGSEDGKGYSGFTVRTNPPQDMQIVTSQTELGDDALNTTASWVDVSGRFGETDATSGIAILTHPSLPEFPPRWLLRYYGMQNVMYPGEGKVTLPEDKPLVLRHRLCIHRGNAEKAQIADQQAVYEQLD